MRNALIFITAIVISLGAGAAGSVFTAPAIESGWYAALAKSALNPPAWVFATVWTILYALMGVSLFLVWRQHSNILKNVGMLRVWRIGMGLFATQLALNVFWSALFFGMRSPGGAFIDIIALWLVILATAVVYANISKTAVWLLTPYLLWVGFAVYLNYTIWMLN